MEAIKTVRAHGKDFLWPILFLIIFINGFESGGYQASLWSIGQNYDLSIASIGLFAAVELLADMLAPILLGNVVDRVGKGKSMLVALALQVASSLFVLFTQSSECFVGGMFVLGLTTSTMQFTAIAALADAYPVSGKKRIGYLTSMYALGAVVSPLCVSFYLGLGISWRALFVLLALGSVIAFVGIKLVGTEAREKAPKNAGNANVGRFVLSAILLLCVIMCIYVGFENGFAFFVDTLFTEVLNASTGKLALSLYWAVMIPARVLVGYNAKHADKILLGSVIAIPLVAILMALTSNSTVVMLLVVPLGLASGAIYPSVLSIMIPFAGERTATATGMITAATGIGGFALTALTGFMADQWGMQMALVVLSAFFVISIAAVLRLRAMLAR
ncbi:MAG: MFS transporter [Coriobacteriales bacterium]|nr:MFS transporter [Coriobacteriales bacterium]